MFAVFTNDRNNLTTTSPNSTITSPQNITRRVRLPYISLYGGFSAVNQQSLNN